MVTIRKAEWTALPEIYAGHLRAADALTVQYGRGPWSGISLVKTALQLWVRKSVFAFMGPDGIMGSCVLDPSPLAGYQREWFDKPFDPALYLSSMSIDPAHQRRGIGRSVMRQIEDISRQTLFRSIRLDAYQGPAGAGAFYEKCGYKKICPFISNGVPLDIYEKTL